MGVNRLIHWIGGEKSWKCINWCYAYFSYNGKYSCLSIANARLGMLLGAGYLFIINAYFIFLAASIALTVLNVPRTRELSENEWRKHRLRMVRNTIIIAIPSIIAVYAMI